MLCEFMTKNGKVSFHTKPKKCGAKAAPKARKTPKPAPVPVRRSSRFS